MVISTVLAVAVLCGAGVSGGISKCDPAITGQLSSLYANGVPQNIIQQLIPYGKFYYKLVSADEVNQYPVPATSLAITFTNSKNAVASYKFPLLPTINIPFAVKEVAPGIIQQTVTPYYKFYILCMINGLVCTYRCCDTCTGTGHNVGVAMSEKVMKTSSSQLEEAKAVMKKLGIDQDLVTLY